MEEQYIIDKEYFRLIDKAVKSGYKRKQDVVEKLKKDGFWKEEDEKEITNLMLEIDSHRQTKKHQIYQSLIKELDEKIKECEKKLIKKENELNELVETCAEFYANQRINDLYIKLAFYTDENLTNKLMINEDDFDVDEISELANIFTKESYEFTESNIKKMMVQDSFLSFFFLCDSIKDFFGREIYKLTFYQIKLASYGRYFKNIYENNDMEKIPEHIRKDPDKLIDHLNTTKNIEKTLNKDNDIIDNQDDRQVLMKSTAIFGAKKEDLEQITGGVPQGPSIFDKVKESGGVLSLQDMIAGGMFKI